MAEIHDQILHVMDVRGRRRTTFLNICQYFPYNERRVRRAVLELRDEGKLNIEVESGRVLIKLAEAAP